MVHFDIISDCQAASCKKHFRKVTPHRSIGNTSMDSEGGEGVCVWGGGRGAGTSQRDMILCWINTFCRH